MLASMTLLTLVTRGVSATQNRHQSHQIPRDVVLEAIPANWTSVGCFTDVSTARTLQGQFTSDNNNMTVEACIAQCIETDFIFAGVEFGQECYCDSTIQSPGTSVSLNSCNIPCTGNANETCGGSGHIHVFQHNGQPAPAIAPVLQDDKFGMWGFEGCFIDSPTARVLDTPIDVSEGVTPKACVDVCSDSGFTRAGVEDGHECWCDTATSTSPFSNDVNITQAPDTDCRGVCFADHGEYCGNANRIAVYGLNKTASAPCSQSNSNFTLVATSDDGHEETLKVVLTEMTANGVWSVLSACSLCCSDYPSLSLQNGVIMPHSLSNPNQIIGSVSTLSAGDSPAFTSSTKFDSTSGAGVGTGYCTVNSLLSLGGRTDGFALCRNSSTLAAGRMDVVFEPKAGHENYVLEECKKVVIKMV